MATAVRNPFDNAELTQSEAELYDRQIRLWGVDAQNRIRASKILIVGLSGLGAEIAKNLILAGPKLVTLLDDHEITGNDSLSQFLVPPNSGSKNRAEASYDFCHRLNPLVELEVDTSNLRDKSRQYYEKFNLIILIDQDYDVIDQANIICRENKIAFIAGGVFGWAGYGFFDFTGRDFLITKPKIQNATVEDDEEEGQPGPSARPVPVVVTVQDDEKVKQELLFHPFTRAFDVSSKRMNIRMRRTIPRSYFLIKTLLRHNPDIPLTDQVLEEEYRRELDANSHYPSSEETLSAYQLFTGPQLGAVCAIIGGFIAQEAIKSLSQNGEPLRNVLTYSALETAYVNNLPPSAV